MNSALAARKPMASNMRAIFSPLGFQSIFGKTKYSQIPCSTSTLRTEARSFFEQIELTMPRRDSSITASWFSGR